MGSKHPLGARPQPGCGHGPGNSSFWGTPVRKGGWLHRGSHKQFIPVEGVTTEKGRGWGQWGAPKGGVFGSRWGKRARGVSVCKSTEAEGAQRDREAASGARVP